MLKFFVALVLLLRFLKAVVLSGVQTVQVILRASTGSRTPPPAAFLRLRFAPMSPMGASLLGCMITLTPGTTTLDIDMEKHEILMHVLDASDMASIEQGIRSDFERSLIKLFGEQRA